jgi:hypothetical protein
MIGAIGMIFQSIVFGEGPISQLSVCPSFGYDFASGSAAEPTVVLLDFYDFAWFFLF